jgi:glycosyltransferase involved in cell wall biosynthesis
VSLSETMSLDKTILESMVAGVPVLIYNEAFTPVFLQAGVDPAPSILQNGRPETMARGLEDWHAHAGARRDDIARLAACVREHHSLQGLAARVKDQITNLVMEPKS